MIDNIRLRLYRFRTFNPENFYCTTIQGKETPYVDTLIDFSCHSTIDTNNKYVGYKLKSHLRTSLGYKPHKILIQDIPFTERRFCLLIDLSLPKMLYGHNVFEITEGQLKEVIDVIYIELLRLGIEIDKEELLITHRISRIDYCKNVLVKKPIPELIEILNELEKQRSKRYYHYTPSISYGSKKKRLNIYDKISEVIAKASKNPESVTYKLAKLLEVLQKNYDVQIFRIEQRLYGKQTLVRELKDILDQKEITFKTLFSEKIASKILSKHWTQLAHEGKIKALLLGKQDLHFIIEVLTRISRQQTKKNINPFYAIYTKLLQERGEGTANTDMQKMREATSIKTYKKELYELMQYLPLHSPLLADHQTITTAIKEWKLFELPILPN